MNSIKIISLILFLSLSINSYAESSNETINIKFVTTSGDFIVELYPEKASKTVENFLKYVDDGFYNGTIFHRVINKFMIQGGGYTKNFDKKSTRPPIENESDNGLKNVIGSIAMARTQAIHSATAQFFINTSDNPSLNYNNGKHGYSVFGKVVKGYDIISGIESAPTGNHNSQRDVPVKQVVIKSVSRIKIVEKSTNKAILRH